MRAAVAILLLGVAAIALKHAIDRCFLTDETRGDAATTVAFIVFVVLLVEAGLILLEFIPRP